ncbi:MAG: hypothetical protein FD176_3432 [Rhodospirillaceae bacterium]|nr:MAG: hypothetical protein FD176_3432 [Rhodospirillaceae bacterium]TNC94209.1 MAG: hypothetical protein FD119_3378 [Stygiobacter sp.]
MTMRGSDMVLAAMLAGVMAVGATWAVSAGRVRAEQPEVLRRAALVERLGLTDLALFTEARYTRHPSQSDRHAAFQDHPFALEHFPSGSVLPPRRGRP